MAAIFYLFVCLQSLHKPLIKLVHYKMLTKKVSPKRQWCSKTRIELTVFILTLLFVKYFFVQESSTLRLIEMRYNFN